MENSKRSYSQNRFLEEKLKSNEFLIVAHRGSSKGNIMENSVQSTKIAFLEGADIVEVDVIRSLDGKFYGFHDGMEKYITESGKNILEMTSCEIEKLDIYNKIFGKSGYNVTPFENILSILKEGQMINIDRSWNYWDTFLDYLDGFDVLDKVILKSHPEEGFLELLERHGRKYMYFPIVKTKEQIENTMSFTDINLVGFELIAPCSTSELFDRNVISSIKKEGYFVFVNAEKLSHNNNLFAGFDDDKSIEEGFDKGWGKLLEMGANIIQTDWTHLLDRYRSGRDKN